SSAGSSFATWRLAAAMLGRRFVPVDLKLLAVSGFARIWTTTPRSLVSIRSTWARVARVCAAVGLATPAGLRTDVLWAPAAAPDDEDDFRVTVDKIRVIDDPRAHQLSVLQPDAHEEDGRARPGRRRHRGTLGGAALLDRQHATRSCAISSKRGDGTRPSG